MPLLKNKVFFLALGVTVLLILGGGWLWWQQSQRVATPQQQPVPTEDQGLEGEVGTPEEDPYLFGVIFLPDSTFSQRIPADPFSESPLSDEGTFPDLDLHLYANDGRHIGMNYETGEYEVDVPDAVVQGGSSTEWIFVPITVIDPRFVVSAHDNEQFLQENPDIASQLNDVFDTYGIYARAFLPGFEGESGTFTSPTLTDQVINPGENKNLESAKRGVSAVC